MVLARVDREMRRASYVDRLAFPPAVLQRPAPLRPLLRPAQQLQMAGAGGYCSSAAELAAIAVHRHHRVRALVAVALECHLDPSPPGGIRVRSADTPEWGRCHAPIKSRRPP